MRQKLANFFLIIFKNFIISVVPVVYNFLYLKTSFYHFSRVLDQYFGLRLKNAHFYLIFHNFCIKIKQKLAKMQKKEFPTSV